jgi:activator of HSP90 ATPase
MRTNRTIQLVGGPCDGEVRRVRADVGYIDVSMRAGRPVSIFDANQPVEITRGRYEELSPESNEFHWQERR